MRTTRFLALAVLLASAAAVLPALPKVAVLDAVVAEGISKSVVVPITDKIAEEIVKALRYSVLDRANIEQVLKEKEFQVSGMVPDSEIKQAGKYLGADYVVVVRVSLIENTYFISAKMIDVESGAVVAQVSDQQEGKATVLIAIAERVGKKLVGGVVEVAAGPQGKPAEEPTKAEEPKKTEEPARAAAAAPQPEPAAVALRPASTVVAEIGLPSAGGSFGGATADWVDYWYTTGGIAYDYSTLNLSLGLRASFYVLPFLYVGAALEHAQQFVSFTDAASYESRLTTSFTSTAFMVTAGYGKALTPFFQFYAGGKVGYAVLALGDFWSSANGWTYDWEGYESSGICFGIDAAAELILLRFLAISLRVDWTMMTVPSETATGYVLNGNYFSGLAYDPPYTYSRLGVSLGAGIALGGRK